MLGLIFSLWLSTFPLIIYTATGDKYSSTTHFSHHTACQQKTEVVLIFISLNLPDHQLKRLYQEAQTSKIPTQFFLRELYQGSIQGTTERLKYLNIKANIDPEWFNHDEIKAVLPTFVLVGEQQNPIVLHGAISLAFAIEKMYQQK